MDPEVLEVKRKYKTTADLKACFYDANDCVMPNMIDLPVGTELTYIGPDAEDGYVFENGDGTKYCLHDNDLAALAES